MLEGDRLRVRVNCDVLYKVLVSGGGADLAAPSSAESRPHSRVQSASTIKRSTSSTQLASFMASDNNSSNTNKQADDHQRTNNPKSLSSTTPNTSADSPDEAIEEVVVPGSTTTSKKDSSNLLSPVASPHSPHGLGAGATASEVFRLLYTRSGYNAFKRWVRNGGYPPTNKEGMLLLSVEPAGGTPSGSFTVDETSFVRVLRATTDMSDVEALELYDTLCQRKSEVSSTDLFLAVSGLVASESCQLTLYLYLHSRDLFEAFGGHRSSISFDQFCALARMIGLGPGYVLELLAPYKVGSGEDVVFGFDEFVCWYYVVFNDWDARPLPTGLTTTSPFGRPNVLASQQSSQQQSSSSSLLKSSEGFTAVSRFCVIS